MVQYNSLINQHKTYYCAKDRKSFLSMKKSIQILLAIVAYHDYEI